MVFGAALVFVVCASHSPAQLAVTNLTVGSAGVQLAWSTSTNSWIVAESTSLSSQVFRYVGDVLATNVTCLTNSAPDTCFYRLRRVGIVIIPDANLEAAIRAAMPAAHAPVDHVYDIDLEPVTSLDAEAADISDPSGLEHLGNLVQLRVGGNRLSSLALPLPALRQLVCDNNLLGSLDVGGSPRLQVLSCDNNFLPGLDLSSCSALEVLSCRINELQALDLSNCPALRVLHCEFNQLTNLDLTTCTNVLAVACDDNPLLTRLQLGAGPCTNLSCARGALTNLDLRQSPALLSVDCRANALTALNVGGCANLQSLTCDENALTAIDLSDAGTLVRLSCSSNSLTALDVSACAHLQELYADGNAISDVSSLGALAELRVISLLGNPVSDLSPLMALASTWALAGCKLYLSGNTIDLGQVAALESNQVEVTYYPSWP